MAALSLSQLNPNLRLGFQSPSSSTRSNRIALRLRSSNIPNSTSLPRFSYGASFLLRKKTVRAPFASVQAKATDSGGSNETETTPQGPPFLTIVAGAIVFFLFCWVLGSFVIWLVSPIVNLLISK